ncbi:MAG: hypothetical protein K2K87_13100 [Lachnospiraceae bacterium]|nr:hypothetical protein [Lachnospiraceae bacterium]
MMYVHYCKRCSRIHMLNGHKMYCPKCEQPLTELRIPYMEYVSMDREERELFRRDWQNETVLEQLSAHYRMYKYSKWYKKLQEANRAAQSDAAAFCMAEASSPRGASTP